MAFRSRRLPPELINELIKFVDGPACRKRLISTNILCYLLLHNTKRANCWRVDAIHLREATTKYGPNRLLALVPSLDHHRSGLQFFAGFAFAANDVGQHVTARDYVEGREQLRFYVSLNAGKERAVLWDLALVTFESLDVLLGNWNALMDVMHSRLSMIRSAQPVEPIVGGPTTDSPPNLT